MPFAKNESRDYVTQFQGEIKEPEVPGLYGTLESAFKMENPVVNAAQLMSRPAFTPQDGFQVGPYLRDYDGKNRSSIFENYRNRFIGVQSEEETLYNINQIKEEEANRDTLSRAGWTGVVAGVGAGLLSPETFIPLVGWGRGAKAVLTGAALGAAAAGPSSAILYANQLTRKPGDVAFDIAASTALGGLIGGAASVLRKGEREVLEQEIMDASGNFPAPNRSVGAAENVGADAGGLASGARTAARINDATKVFTNPVTQTINQEDLPTWRKLMSMVSDSGLELENNRKGIAALEGGTIENRTITWTGPLVKAIESTADEYGKYFFDGAAPKIAPQARAFLQNTFNGAGKLSRNQFNEQVTMAIWNGFEHDIPEVVQAAKKATAQVFEPMLKEAQATGLIGKDVELVGDKAYAQRIYNTTAIQTRTQQFVDILAKNYEKQLSGRFTDELGKFVNKQAKKGELAEDLTRPVDEIDALTTKFKEQLKALDDNLPEDTQRLEDAIAEARANARALLKEPASLTNETQRKQLLADARAMEKSMTPAQRDRLTEKAYLRGRLKNLSQSAVAYDAKQGAKIERLQRVEELQLNSLDRFGRKVETTLAKLDRWSDERLDEELSNLRSQFNKTADVYDRGEARLAKLEEGPALGVAEDAQTSRAARLDDISAKLDAAEGLDREGIRATLTSSLEDVRAKVNGINSRRAVRAEKLRKDIAGLDPELAKARIKAVQDSIPKAEDEFVRRWEGPNGADSVDIPKGIADFKTLARESAENVKDTIVGTYNRLPYSEVMGKERGAELARVLDIPSREIADFLEKDIDKVMSVYTKTLAPDIELKRAFGSFDWRQIIQPAVEERANALNRIASAKDKAGNPRDQKWMDKETRRINDAFDTHSNNFSAVISRLRGTRGLPAEPDGFAYRAARTIMQLNTLRMMGMVTTASIPDVGRPIMRYGLTRVFKDGFIPLVTNLKAMKMSMREGILAGAAAEVATHARASALHDITNGMQRGTGLEKALDWASNRMGQIALFDYWTQGGKMLTSAITNAKMMESLEKVATGNGLIHHDEAVSFLAQNGLTGNLPKDIWKEVVDNAGGGKVNGVWWPNTESWKNGENVRAYRAALAREINNTIVSPGLEKPLLADSSIVGRMLYQFKSFGMSATPKIMMAGMQQRDAGILSGSIASLGMGALSYYLWGIASGGKAFHEMMDAPIEKWADEAINRSGLTAGLGEIQRVAQTVPGLANYASFSGQRQTRRPGDDLPSALLGPSFDFLTKSGNVVTGLSQPTSGTVKQAFDLLPFQNTIILRHGVEAVEKAISSHLPERRN